MTPTPRVWDETSKTTCNKVKLGTVGSRIAMRSGKARRRSILADLSLVARLHGKMVPCFEDLKHSESAIPRQMALCTVETNAAKSLEQLSFGLPLPFLSAAAATVLLGVVSVIPYNIVLQKDPGSPLFVSFIDHLLIIAKNLPNSRGFVRQRKLPLAFHAGIVVFASAFTVLKSDAYVRLPASVCILLSNLRMLLGVVIQFIIFGQKHSQAQLLGVVLATSGIAWAGSSMQRATTAFGGLTGDSNDLLIGVLEILGSSTALALLSSTVKIAVSRYGEIAEEQMFVQHLCALPLIFPSQWEKVGPRFGEWYHRGDSWLVLNLILSVVTTFAARRAAATMAGRSPSLLMTQLVQTIECFLQLLLVALMQAPPWPPIGFWCGSVLLLAGSIHYVHTSYSADRQSEHAKSC